MVFINRNFSRGWNKNCYPQLSETFALYSQENDASTIVDHILTEESEKYCFLFRALGMPSIIEDIRFEFDSTKVYIPNDAHKFFIKRFPQLLVYNLKKSEIPKVLNHWTTSACERRFLYCVHRESIDSVITYFENVSYTDLSEGALLWDHLEFFLENIPEFEYDDSFSITARPKYLSQIAEIGKKYGLTMTN